MQDIGMYLIGATVKPELFCIYKTGRLLIVQSV
jgi:hypothetical protein